MKETKEINGLLFESNGEWLEIEYSEELDENDDYEQYSYFRINGDIERINEYTATDRNSDLYKNGLHAYKVLSNSFCRFLELDKSGDSVKIWYQI